MGRSSLLALLTFALIGALPGDVRGQGAPRPHAERFVLSGLMLFEDGSGLVWIKEHTFTGDRVVVMRPGESLGPYRLTAIREDRVELEGPSGTVVVPVYTAQGDGGPGVSAAAPRGGARGPSHPGVAGVGADAVVPSPGASLATRALRLQPDAVRAQALREQIEASGRQLERSRQQEARRAERAAAGAGGAAPRAAGESPSPGGSSAAAAAPGGSTSQPSVPNVIYPPKGQTFQSALGLN